jgi:hypothetical protein
MRVPVLAVMVMVAVVMAVLVLMAVLVVVLVLLVLDRHGPLEQPQVPMRSGIRMLVHTTPMPMTERCR